MPRRKTKKRKTRLWECGVQDTVNLRNMTPIMAGCGNGYKITGTGSGKHRFTKNVAKKNVNVKMKILKKIYSKIRHWCCKVGLCNFDSCGCDCHENAPKTTIVKNVFKPHLDEIAPPKQGDNLEKMVKKEEPVPTIPFRRTVYKKAEN